MRCSLQDLPEHWDSTKQLCLRVKQNVAPLQANEVNAIRRKCQEFEVPALGLGRKRAASRQLQETPAALPGCQLPAARPEPFSPRAGPAAHLPGEVSARSPFLVH